MMKNKALIRWTVAGVIGFFVFLVVTKLNESKAKLAQQTAHEKEVIECLENQLGQTGKVYFLKTDPTAKLRDCGLVESPTPTVFVTESRLERNFFGSAWIRVQCFSSKQDDGRWQLNWERHIVSSSTWLPF